jgi:hypothetical protein
VRRLEVFHLTGATATNEKVARRLAKKSRSLLALKQTVLLDFEGVTTIEDSFFAIVTNLPNLDQVKVCGVSAPLRAKLLASNIPGVEQVLIP